MLKQVDKVHKPSLLERARREYEVGFGEQSPSSFVLSLRNTLAKDSALVQGARVFDRRALYA